MTDSRNNGPVTRGRPFEPGNPGRPKGSRNKATLAAEALLDGEAETLTRKAIDLANAGDTTALRMCIERILPARKDRPVPISLPPITNPADAVTVLAAITSAVSDGEITMEASELSKVVDSYTRAVETRDIVARLDRLAAEKERK